MKQPGVVASCPNDGGPLKPFRCLKAPPGCTIELHGCRLCDFDYVIAFASDATGWSRLVGQWSFSPASGEYVLVQENGTNPPEWLDLVRAALPERDAPQPVQFDEQGNPI